MQQANRTPARWYLALAVIAILSILQFCTITGAFVKPASPEVAPAKWGTMALPNQAFKTELEAVQQTVGADNTELAATKSKSNDGAFTPFDFSLLNTLTSTKIL